MRLVLFLTRLSLKQIHVYYLKTDNVIICKHKQIYMLHTERFSSRAFRKSNVLGAGFRVGTRGLGVGNEKSKMVGFQQGSTPIRNRFLRIKDLRVSLEIGLEKGCD